VIKSNTLTINKETFVKQFLFPISKLSDNISLQIEPGKIYTTCNSQDGSVVLYAELKTDTDNLSLPKINIPDLKKFLRLLECTEESTLQLKIDSNHIKYQTSSLKFNYFLIDDNYIPRNPINPEKIKQLQFDLDFKITNTKFNEIVKGSSITTDTDKLYFYIKDNCIYAELNDRERQNINNITYLVTDEFTGDVSQINLPINLESFRALSGIHFQHLLVKINNQLKVIVFENNTQTTTTKFIISALVK